MAKLMLIGAVAHVELLSDNEDGGTFAVCREHVPGPDGWPAESCNWTNRYDDLNDASEYAADHADTGRE